METVRGLKDHIRVHTGLKLYKCGYCHTSFGCREILACHITVHTGHKLYKCYVCNNSFSFKSMLSDHLKTHTADRCHVCGHCKKGFTTRGCLTSHIRHVHAKQMYKCIICTKSFGVETALKRHIAIHATSKSFSCGLCNKNFRCQYDLRCHLEWHQVNANFVHLFSNVMYATDSFHKNTLSQHIWACIRERKISFAKYVTNDSPWNGTYKGTRECIRTSRIRNVLIVCWLFATKTAPWVHPKNFPEWFRKFCLM